MHPRARFPVEVVARILSFVLASPADGPQKLPTARAHPISILLVSKEITRLVLPYFYRSITIVKSEDWNALFNPVYGVLAHDEKDTPESGRRFPPLAIRQGWVRELFLGPCDGGPSSDWARSLHGIDIEDDPSCDTLTKVRLPNLATLVLSNLPVPRVSESFRRVVGIAHSAGYQVNSYEPSKLFLSMILSLLPSAHASLHVPATTDDHTFTPDTMRALCEVIGSDAKLFLYLPPRRSGRRRRTSGLPPLLPIGPLAPSLPLPSPTPLPRDTILVGSLQAVRGFLNGDDEEERWSGWEWLAPDGSRQDAQAALNEAGLSEDEEAGHESEEE